MKTIFVLCIMEYNHNAQHLSKVMAMQHVPYDANRWEMPSDVREIGRCVGRWKCESTDVMHRYLPFEHIPCIYGEKVIPDSFVEVFICKECYNLYTNDSDNSLAGMDWYDAISDLVSIVEKRK